MNIKTEHAGDLTAQSIRSILRENMVHSLKMTGACPDDPTFVLWGELTGLGYTQCQLDMAGDEAIRAFRTETGGDHEETSPLWLVIAVCVVALAALSIAVVIETWWTEANAARIEAEMEDEI